MQEPVFRPGEDKATHDPETGVMVCPECQKYFNPRCGNCFHSRAEDDPFEPSSDILASLK